MSKAFNEDQIDALREFINISLGAATANLADLLGTFVKMYVPKIEICENHELLSKIDLEVDSKSMYYATKQLFTGKFGGECMFLMNNDSANNLGVHLYDFENPSKDDILDAVIELTNILSSTIISRLTQELGIQVQFFVPSSQYVDAKSILDAKELDQYSKIIIISTIIESEDQKIQGNIYILTKDEAIESLEILINKKLEEIYG